MADEVELLTVGYEGEELSAFVDKLKAAGVERLIDVRFTPLSRKRGFSKTPLSEALEVAGIEYVHYKELGTLKQIRDDYKRTKDFSDFRRRYDAYLNDQARPMAVVYGLAATKRSALLCFEADHRQCHRAILAERMARDFHGEHTLHITHLPPAGAPAKAPKS